MSAPQGASASPNQSGRPRRALAASLATVAVAGLGLGLAGFHRLPGEGAPAFTGGEQLRIEVVQPPAPDIDPGSRMDVGELVDGYRHVSVRRDESEFETLPVLAWLEPLSDSFIDRHQADFTPAPVLAPTARQPEAVESRSGPRNPYGFDGPSPDWAAARRARREQAERVERVRAQVNAAIDEADRRWRRLDAETAERWRPRQELARETTFY